MFDDSHAFLRSVLQFMPLNIVQFDTEAKFN